jgi:hypothetical protein
MGQDIVISNEIKFALKMRTSRLLVQDSRDVRGFSVTRDFRLNGVELLSTATLDPSA